MSECSTEPKRGLQPLSHRWVLWPALSFLIVLAAGFVFKRSAWITRSEYRVDQFLAAHRSGPLNIAADVLNQDFGATFGPVGAVIFFVAVWARTRSMERTATAVFIVAAGCFACWIMKTLVGRESPPGAGPLWISYPSGHTAFAMAVAAALFWLARGTRGSSLALTVGGILVFAVGMSRLYLGVHYPSDVLAACVLSLGSAVFATGAARLVLATRTVD